MLPDDNVVLIIWCITRPITISIGAFNVQSQVCRMVIVPILTVRHDHTRSVAANKWLVKCVGNV